MCWYVRLLPFCCSFILTTLLIILACDYLNSKREHWVPVLAILCDGEKFEFLVYDSVIKSVYSSRVDYRRVRPTRQYRPRGTIVENG